MMISVGDCHCMHVYFPYFIRTPTRGDQLFFTLPLQYMLTYPGTLQYSLHPHICPAQQSRHGHNNMHPISQYASRPFHPSWSAWALKLALTELQILCENSSSIFHSSLINILYSTNNQFQFLMCGSTEGRGYCRCHGNVFLLCKIWHPITSSFLSNHFENWTLMIYFKKQFFFLRVR
jgi:hypothetical protein